MKKISLFLFAISILNIAYSQTYETLNKVYIPEYATIIKTVKVKNCSDVFPKGYIVKKEYKKKNGDIEYTLTRTDSLTKDSVYLVEKSITKEIKSFGGYANITVDEKDKSILHVNYWLNPFNKVKEKIQIKIRNRKMNCNEEFDSKDTVYNITKDTTFNLYMITEKFFSDTTKDWFKNSSQIIEVYKEKEPGTLDYYLVNKYDKNADYTIKMENREFKSYRKQGIEFGVVTIPFKYRFGYTKNNIQVKQEFQADLNVGVFGGYKLGRYRVRYEGTTLKDLANLSCTIGGFLNLSTTTLDSISTTLGKVPFKKEEKASIGVLAPGIGIMASIYNFQIGAFLGWDLGFGQYAKQWNFNGRPWLGFGIGYNLTSFWKK